MPSVEATYFEPCAEFAECDERWQLPADLLGGTLTMRERGTRWLPQEPRENPLDYQTRLQRSTLFGAFSRAVHDSAARPFKRQVLVAESGRLTIPDADEFLQNVDGDDTTITEFGRDLYEDAAGFGVSRFLVDWDGRPIWRHVKARDLIFWDYAEDGRTLSEIRIRGTLAKRSEKNPGKLEECETVRRYWLENGVAMTAMYSRPKGGGVRAEPVVEMVPQPLLATGNAPITSLPLVSSYFRKVGRMGAWPPFEQLADLNLRHWQSSSDQANILRYARIPALFARGIDPENLEGKKLQAGGVWAASDEKADLKYVEPTGAAIASGHTDLLHIESQMERVGAQPNARKAGVQTATGQLIDEASRDGYRAAWSRSIERALTLGLWWVERWNGVEMPDDVVVSIHEDDELSPSRENRARVAMELHKQGAITRATLLKEAQENGVLSEELDTEEEAEAARQEFDSPFAGSIGDDEEDSDIEDAEPVSVGADGDDDL